MNIREIRKDWVIERAKKSFKRYCSICGESFVANSPTVSICSDLCHEKQAKELNQEVYGILIEAVPQALSNLGFDSVEDYIQSKVEKETEDNNGFVYFVKADVTIKIGYAKDVYKRLKALQTANPIQLELIGYIPGNKEKESSLHALFDDYRLSGEWFKYSDEIREYIASLNLITGEEQVCQNETQAENSNPE